MLMCYGHMHKYMSSDYYVKYMEQPLEHPLSTLKFCRANSQCGRDILVYNSYIS